MLLILGVIRRSPNRYCTHSLVDPLDEPPSSQSRPDEQNTVGLDAIVATPGAGALASIARKVLLSAWLSITEVLVGTDCGCKVKFEIADPRCSSITRFISMLGDAYDGHI
jgi:hypothetical protein